MTVSVAVVSLSVTAGMSRGDEGGISFWLPGQYGSLAAVPQQPGWQLATVYYHTSVDAGADLSAARQVQVGRFKSSVNVNLKANMKANADLGIVVPSYAFETPVFGAQLAVGVTAIYGRMDTSLTGEASASLGPLAIVRSGSISDDTTGFGDLYPNAVLRWNAGIHNYMAYLTGGIPVGKYSSDSLANIGIGHAAIDAGVGYTYFNPANGREFSAVAGLTQNFENGSTGYTNGYDFHVDWAASQFLSKQMHVGLVGYFYQQLTADSGQPAFLGDFESRVVSIGPQIGFVFPMGEMQSYLNLKGYKEFAAENRAEGWNAWATFVVSRAPRATR